MKKCTSCFIDKNLNEFPKANGYKFGVHSKCKVCLTEYSNNWKLSNRDKLKKNQQRYCNKNKEKVKEQKKRYLINNCEKRKESVRKYYLKNKSAISEKERKLRHKNLDRYRAYCSLRRSIKIKATPVWITKEQLKLINNIYKEARNLELKMNEKFHVDHIVPLNSDIVCGLHVPWNLQILKASDNMKKGNKLIDLHSL
jgi:hypothetical protein